MFFGSLVALITPFTENNEIDQKALRELICWHIENKTDAIVCCGTTGESPTLSDDEKLEIYKICVEEAKGRITVIAGTGTYNTKHSRELTKKAKELGVDGALIVVPYYNRPTQQGCIEHYKEIAKENLPMIIYHHPGRTGVKLKPETFAELEKIKNVVNIKEASGDFDYAVEIMNHCSIPILSGDDLLTLTLMERGAKGVISVIANIIPNEWKKLTEWCLIDNFDEALRIHNKYESLNKAMLLETNPQCVKYALSLLKKCRSSVRLPLLKPVKSSQEKIYEEITKCLG